MRRYNHNHRRYYQIAGITVQVEADIPITDATFHPKFKIFEVDEPGTDTITIRHCFSLPSIKDFGDEVYRKPPWAIYKKNGSWIYEGILADKNSARTKLLSRIFHCLCFLRAGSHRHKNQWENSRSWLRQRSIYMLSKFNHDHSTAIIYSRNKRLFRQGNLHSLTLFPTDQILLARVLAQRQGCYFHASGVILDGKGFLFVGHSEAGKSTMATILKNKAKILCDDRMIVRKWDAGFRIHGSWSYGDVSDISPDSTPLKAIFFLKQDRKNRIIPIEHEKESIRRLLACLIKPLVTADWWDKMLTLVGSMVHEVPCYCLHFDKSDDIANLLNKL